MFCDVRLIFPMSTVRVSATLPATHDVGTSITFSSEVERSCSETREYLNYVRKEAQLVWNCQSGSKDPINQLTKSSPV